MTFLKSIQQVGIALTAAALVSTGPTQASDKKDINVTKCARIQAMLITNHLVMMHSSTSPKKAPVALTAQPHGQYSG